MSANNNFTVTVNPLTNPVIGSVTAPGGQVSLTVNRPQWPDYTQSTTTNSPLTLVDTNPAAPARFHRIQIGP